MKLIKMRKQVKMLNANYLIALGNNLVSLRLCYKILVDFQTFEFTLLKTIMKQKALYTY